MSAETTSTYPEHDKLAKVKELSQAIGEFLAYQNERQIWFREWAESDNHPEGGYWVPIVNNANKLIAEYFKIDLKKLEQEKRRMLLTLSGC